jgi:xylan 1,4-beta-xylosidase
MQTLNLKQPAILKVQIFLNPIFAGDYPDPSILRDGDTYYIVHSSFEYYPGLQIWRSKDLINWTPVVNTLNKYLGSVWAPDLAKHKDKYYNIFLPMIKSLWFGPIRLKVSGAIPSI